jgi:hypothetical protein
LLQKNLVYLRATARIFYGLFSVISSHFSRAISRIFTERDNSVSLNVFWYCQLHCYGFQSYTKVLWCNCLQKFFYLFENFCFPNFCTSLKKMWNFIIKIKSNEMNFWDFRKVLLNAQRKLFWEFYRRSLVFQRKGNSVHRTLWEKGCYSSCIKLDTWH